MSTKEEAASRFERVLAMANTRAPKSAHEGIRWVDACIDYVGLLRAENEELRKQRDEAREILHEEGYNICGPSCDVCRADRSLE